MSQKHLHILHHHQTTYSEKYIHFPTPTTRRSEHQGGGNDRGERGIRD